MDIGGTFTDFVLLDDASGELKLHKRATTPADPAEGALQGLEELLGSSGLALPGCSMLVHGTTLVTNAVIERRGARTALLTTRGFRDVLEMGREQRYDIYDLTLQFPEPLVPRRWRLEVEERLTVDGESLRRPSEREVREQVGRLVEFGVESLAIVFLHSFRNASHERAAAALVTEEFPQLAVCISSEVAPQIREYERTSTTVCNAYVQPLIERYLRRLERELELRGFSGHFYLMQSSGGLASPDVARRFPVRLLESGPAGGALVGAYLGRQLGLSDLLAFDMGGTTAKICLVQGHRPTRGAELEVARVHRFKRGSGIPVTTPVLELMEMGAGGGSIAFSNRLNLLQVGPESAGANPGPACYGLGGTRPTVTDACLKLGYLDPAYFLGGAIALDVEAADRSLAGLGQALGLTNGVAWGVYSVVSENMAAAARIHIIEKGRDPRRFPLIAFGGAGPVHAVRVARALGTREVIVPPVSGVASALGFLVAPVSFEFSRSYPGELRSLDWDQVLALYREMEDFAVAQLASANVSQVHFEREAEMRLSGQFHDIVVPLLDYQSAEFTEAELRAAFEREYARLYHTVPRGYEPMVLNWRLRTSGPEPRVQLPNLQAMGGPAARSTRQAYFPEAGGFVDTAVVHRYRLEPGAELDGPAIVQERESTTVVAPGDRLRVDEADNLRITVSAT